MKKKIFFQIILLLLIFIISLSIYKKYFKQIEITQEKIQKNVVSGNLINNITYKSSDNNGVTYIINSKTGTIDSNNPRLIFMMDVKSEITLNDGSKVYIQSQKAKYNNDNYNTEFQNNVRLDYLEHKMIADNINIYFDQNLLEALNNLTYKNSTMTLIADKIEIDLTTKNTKIFNFDNSEVKIFSNN